MSVKYTIGTLSDLTGLSQHTIRAWERRYNALSPGRTETNRRIYGQDDAERLALIRDVLGLGHSIGQVAALPTEQLRKLTEPNLKVARREIHDLPDGTSSLRASQVALNSLDAEGLEQALVRGTVSLGILGLLENVLVPLLMEIDRRWVDGTISIAQEHMASAIIRSHLDRVRRSIPGPEGAPRILLTTPQNQVHEIGILMAAIVAAMQSWNVTYLGPNLPSIDIAGAARKCGASAVGLSLVFPLDDKTLPGELVILRSQLPDKMPIIVGGRAAPAYREALDHIGAVVVSNLVGFGEALIATHEMPASA